MIGLLIDVTKCIGCERCVSACVDANNLNKKQAEKDKATVPDGLSANRLTTVHQLSEDRFAKKACMHCLEPSCVSACLVGGITRAENGSIVYDPDKCIGCRYCMLACPFHVPRYEWNSTVPFMVKCELCEERVQNDQLPACVETCPEQAIQFGERNELLAKAHHIIDTNPDRYLNHVWGEAEYGGTSVLYISDVDLTAIGWPQNELDAIPEMTRPALEATPYIAGSVFAGVAGINWIVKRRMKLMQQVKSSEDKKAVSGEKE